MKKLILILLFVMSTPLYAYDNSKFTYEYTKNDIGGYPHLGLQIGLTDRLSISLDHTEQYDFNNDGQLIFTNDSSGLDYLISDAFNTDVVMMYRKQRYTAGGACTTTCAPDISSNLTVLGLTARASIGAGFYLLAGYMSISNDESSTSTSSNYFGLDYELTEVIHFTLTSLTQENQQDQNKVGLDFYF